MNKSFPPRAWCRYGDNWIEGDMDRTDPSNKHLYISMEEHEHLIDIVRNVLIEDSKNDHFHMKDVIEQYRNKLDKLNNSAKLAHELCNAHESRIETLESKCKIYEKALEELATGKEPLLDVIMRAISDVKDLE